MERENRAMIVAELRLSRPGNRRKEAICELLEEDSGFQLTDEMEALAEEIEGEEEQRTPAARTRLPGGDLTHWYLAFFRLFLAPLFRDDEDLGEMEDRFVIACTGSFPLARFALPACCQVCYQEEAYYPEEQLDRYAKVAELAAKSDRGPRLCHYLLDDLGAPVDEPYDAAWFDNYVLAYTQSAEERARLSENLAPAQGGSPPKRARN